MDIIATAYYAIVCAVLGFASSSLPSVWIRIGVGAVVGIAASNFLPILKSLIGAG
ncbi:hypothetical protein [Cohaesibacter sp. ES.047]|uniref:hypothetical protein n=1 Tax=Cohaesibacter sp. ES.047 TaxID=1798205 RepID=UPI0012FDCA98|nr:hypothetical protein [Cohaesibacter sp. ES.047]